MTLSEIQAIVEPLDDALKVQWGCIDHTIPKEVYKCQSSDVGTFKAFLETTEQEPYKELATEYEGKLITIRQWLITENAIIFYMGYDED